MVKTAFKKMSLLGAAIAAIMAMGSSPALANSDSGTYTWPNEVKLTANVWGESTCDKCDWTTSSKVTWRGTHYYIAQVRSCATVKEHGLAGSVKVTWFDLGTSTDRDAATRCWTNGIGTRTAWIADLAGRADLAWNTWYASVDSNATGWYGRYGSARTASAGI